MQLLKRQAECACELCTTKVVTREAMALRAAQIENSHHIFCGTPVCPCASCAGVAAKLRLLPESQLRERFGCERAWLRADDAWAAEMANVYFGQLRPGRLGDLYLKPRWLSEVAEIGDLIVAEAEREALHKVK